MGNTPTKVNETLLQLPLQDASNTPIEVFCERPPVIKAYLHHCDAFRGVILPKMTNEEFVALCNDMAVQAHTHFLHKGQQSLCVKGTLFFLLGTLVEVKQFQSHIKGAETLAFLGLPNVTVPHAALVHFLGLSIACLTLTYLHAPVDTISTSKHVALVRGMISKALRLRTDPCCVLYEVGDGNLVVVDASSLLPTLSLRSFSVEKPLHSARPELLLGRDCSWTPASCGMLQIHQGSDPPQSWLTCILNVASAKRSKGTAKTLHAIHSQKLKCSTCLDEKLETIDAVTHPVPLISYNFSHREARDNTSITQFVTGIVLPNVADALETLSDELSGADVINVLHLAGVGMHMLGILWPLLERNGSGRPRIAVEIVARAGKHWLEQKWREGVKQRPSVAPEIPVLELFRGVGDINFLEEELLPIARQKFGPITPPITQKDLLFRPLFSRLQSLCGVTIVQGAVRGILPRIRAARMNYPVTTADEAAMAGVASKRDDGMASTTMIAALAQLAGTTTRLGKMITQLKRLDTTNNIVLTMFVAAMEAALAGVFFRAKQFSHVCDCLERAVPVLAQCCTETCHDRLFATRHTLRLIDVMSKLGKASLSGTYVRSLLRLEPFRDVNGVGVVSTRSMLEEFHKASIDLCFSTHQDGEACIVAQRWLRLCKTLFGPLSAQQCRATKVLLVSLIRSRRRLEATQLAHDYLTLCEGAFGVNDMRTAGAINDLASLVWRKNPRRGLQLYQRALDIYRRTKTTHRGIGSTLYNMGLAAARINRFRASLNYFAKAREIASAQSESTTAAMCDRSTRAVLDIAATKIQRWIRDQLYGVARSQTTRTDLCSTLSWSEDDDIRSTADEIMPSEDQVFP